MIRVVSMLVVSIISNFKNIRKDEDISNIYWFSTIFISFASLYLLMTLFNESTFNQTRAMILGFIILSINFMVIILYDNLYKAFSIKTEKVLLEKQNKAYEMQVKLMQQSFKASQMMNHDMKNHLITLKSLYSNNEISSTNEYIDNAIISIDNGGMYSSSGNFVIDSILNFKIQEAIDVGIVTDIEVAIPEKVNISSFDLTVILGNLLDNAIIALKVYQGKKELTIRIKYSKNNIILTIINSFNGQVKEKDGKLISCKRDKENHGLGLRSVEEILNKNDGHLDIKYDDKYFKVTVLLPAT